MVGVLELGLGIASAYLAYYIFSFYKQAKPVVIQLTSHRGLKASFEVPHASAANIIGQEIYVEEAYIQEGIKLPASPVVVDVGAHCGMFSAWTLQHFPKAVVYAIEPIEPLAAMVRVNTEPFTKNGGRCELLRSACFSVDGRDVILSYAPVFSFGASIFADEVDEFIKTIVEKDRIGFCRALLSDLEKCGLLNGTGRLAARLLDSQWKVCL